MSFPIEVRLASVAGSVGHWVKNTVAGLQEMASGRTTEAASCWLAAEAALGAEAGFDAARAAARSNAGVAHVLLGRRSEAERCLADSEQAWQQVVGGIALLDVPLTGASSSFHFRLAATAPEVLISARRQRYRNLAEAALATTQFNRLFAARPYTDIDLIAARAAELKLALIEKLGAGSPEVRLLAASAEHAGVEVAYAIYADKFVEASERDPTFAAALSDRCAELESAAALNLMLALPIVGRASDEKETASSDLHPLASSQSSKNVRNI